MDSVATEPLPHNSDDGDADQSGRHLSGVFPVFSPGGSVAQESVDSWKQFALRHRETSEGTQAMIEAFGRRIAVAASCLAVGHPTAMLHPDAWHADEFTFERHHTRVALSGTGLENARRRWRLWYHFLTANHFQRGGLSLRVKPFGPTQLCNFYKDLQSRLWVQQELPRRNAWAARYGRLPKIEEIPEEVRKILSEIDQSTANEGWRDFSREALDPKTGREVSPLLAWSIEHELRKEHQRRQMFESRRQELRQCEEGSRLPELATDTVAALMVGIAIGVRDDLVRQGVITSSAPANVADLDAKIELLKPVLCWSLVRAEGGGDQHVSRIGEDLSALFTLVRRWDASGTRARRLAFQQQKVSTGI